MTGIRDLFDNIVEENLLEDRREYDEEMLAHMYGLNPQEAEDLYFLIQREFDPDISQVRFDNIPATTITEYLLEGEHGGWDGWTEHESIIIQRLMDDIKRYYVASLKL